MPYNQLPKVRFLAFEEFIIICRNTPRFYEFVFIICSLLMRKNGESYEKVIAAKVPQMALLSQIVQGWFVIYIAVVIISLIRYKM